MAVRTAPTMHRRRFLIPIITLALLLVIGSDAAAQQIAIKRPFFRGWRYAVDSGKYHRIGSGEDLKTMMQGNRACLGAMKSFNDHATAAKITGVIGILLLAWPISTQIRGKDWAETYTPMVIVGGSFGIISLAMDAAGSRNLKRAVMIHNRSHGFGGDFESALPESPPDGRSQLIPGIRLTLNI